MKSALLIVAGLLFLYGLHWIGQGTGIFPWPAHTIMDDNMAFTWYGLGLIALSGVTVAFARR